MDRHDVIDTSILETRNGYVRYVRDRFNELTNFKVEMNGIEKDSATFTISFADRRMVRVTAPKKALSSLRTFHQCLKQAAIASCTREIWMYADAKDFQELVKYWKLRQDFAPIYTVEIGGEET